MSEDERERYAPANRPYGVLLTLFYVSMIAAGSLGPIFLHAGTRR